MNLENYKISKLPYIENGSNEIMERYQIHAQYETEPRMEMLYILFL